MILHWLLGFLLRAGLEFVDAETWLQLNTCDDMEQRRLPTQVSSLCVVRPQEGARDCAGYGVLCGGADRKERSWQPLFCLWEGAVCSE